MARKKGSHSDDKSSPPKEESFECRSFPDRERANENLWDELLPFLLLLLFGIWWIDNSSPTTKEVAIETPICTKKRTTSDSVATEATEGGAETRFSTIQKLRLKNIQHEGSPVPSLVEEVCTDSSSNDTYGDEFPILPTLSPVAVVLTESGNSSSGSSNDDDSLEAEAEDEFRELPVRFRSLTELADDEEKEEVDATPSAYHATEGEMRARDLRHAEEIAQHAMELEAAHRVVAELRQSHQAELKSLKQKFQVERKQREHLLEQALGYAEELEAAEHRASQDHAFQLEKLREELRDQKATIERLRAEDRRKTDELLRLRSAKSKRFKLNRIKL